MITIPALLLFAGLANAAEDPRATYARELLGEADLVAEGLTDDQAIASAVLLQRAEASRAWMERTARKAEVEGHSMLFRVVVKQGHIQQIALSGETAVPQDVVTKVAQRLSRTRAGWDVDATVFFPIQL